MISEKVILTGPLLRAVVRENRGFLLKFGKCDLTDFDKTLHIQSTLRINNFPAIIDFLSIIDQKIKVLP